MTVAAHALPYRGQTVELGGVHYVMPPLSLRQAEVYWPRMEALQAGAGSPLQALKVAAEVAHACLQRNYPELALATVSDAVDMDNFEQLLAAAAGGRSFRAWLASVEPHPERPLPPPPAADGTGAPSTPASPPPPAGASSASAG